jgi:hypothetical protein
MAVTLICNKALALMRFVLSFLLLSALRLAAEPLCFQAETFLQSGAARMEDAACSDGAFARQVKGEYAPVIRVRIGEEDLGAGEFTVWVRRRGAAVQMKRVVGGKQSEGKWLYAVEADFVWERLGRWSREALGQELLFITAGKSSSPVDMDAVVISADDGPALDALLPELPMVPMTMDWKTKVRDISADAFGLNAFMAHDPQVTNHANYLANLSYMTKGKLRLHHSDSMEDSAKSKHGWMNHRTRTWDAAKVSAALAPLRAAGHELVPCIPHWPTWMDADEDGFLDEEQVEPFASLCAELVRLVNLDQPGVAPMLDWEVTNELDERYHQRFHEAKKKDRLAELVTIYQAVARRMKAVDPRIRVGGISAMNSYNFDFHERFVQACAADLDFYSVHLYVSGKASEPDSVIFKKADGPQYPIAQIRRFLDQASPQRHIPLVLNEFNIGYDWRQQDRRMTTGFGAVWDAWFVLTALEAGADATAAWNECDGVYGKTTAKHERRLGAEAYHLLTTHCIGVQHPASVVTATADIRASAISSESGKRLLLVHRGTRPRRVKLQDRVVATKHVITLQDIQQTAHEGDEVELAPGSLTLLRW